LLRVEGLYFIGPKLQRNGIRHSFRGVNIFHFM
jgi:hypothetical protein